MKEKTLARKDFSEIACKMLGEIKNGVHLPVITHIELHFQNGTENIAKFVLTKSNYGFDEIIDTLIRRYKQLAEA